MLLLNLVTFQLDDNQFKYKLNRSFKSSESLNGKSKIYKIEPITLLQGLDLKVLSFLFAALNKHRLLTEAKPFNRNIKDFLIFN